MQCVSSSIPNKQIIGTRHLKALQRLRDETLLTYAGLELAHESALEKKYEELFILVKDSDRDFAQALHRAKLGVSLAALRRVLQMNSLLLEHLFPDIKDGSDPQILSDRSHALTDKLASGSKQKTNGMVDFFRGKLKASGFSDAPATTLGSLAALERVIREKFSGLSSDVQRPDNLEIILLEMAEASNSSLPLRVKPWKQILNKQESPSVDTRLLNAIFATAIVVAHEATQAADKLSSGHALAGIKISNKIT